MTRDTPASQFIRQQLADAFEAIKDRPRPVHLTARQKAEQFALRRKAWKEQRLLERKLDGFNPRIAAAERSRVRRLARRLHNTVEGASDDE